MRIVILTVSDRCARGEAQDITGPALRGVVEERGAEVLDAVVVPDDMEAIAAALVRAADELGAEVVLTAGGTGLGPRDVTPEATERVLDRRAPGLAEAMRIGSASGWGELSACPTAILSRGTAGLRGRTLIVNLPGSPAGARECLDIIWPVLGHALAMIAGEGH